MLLTCAPDRSRGTAPSLLFSQCGYQQHTGPAASEGGPPSDPPVGTFPGQACCLRPPQVARLSEVLQKDLSDRRRTAEVLHPSPDTQPPAMCMP